VALHNSRTRKNVVLARSFTQLLEEAIRKYQNRMVEAAQILEELIELARQVRQSDDRARQLGMTEDELAFYDALETNESAVAVLGDETLRGIAQELVQSIRNSVTVDWTIRETVRAAIRAKVKRILRRHGYPPDRQERATQLVLEQAETICKDWVEE